MIPRKLRGPTLSPCKTVHWRDGQGYGDPRGNLWGGYDFESKSWFIKLFRDGKEELVASASDAIVAKGSIRSITLRQTYKRIELDASLLGDEEPRPRLIVLVSFARRRTEAR